MKVVMYLAANGPVEGLRDQVSPSDIYTDVERVDESDSFVSIVMKNETISYHKNSVRKVHIFNGTK